MPNVSKLRSRRDWIKWHQSGAASIQVQGTLSIEGIGIHYTGPAAGMTTLSLGRQPLTSYSFRPICWVLVPTSEKFQPGIVLPKLPGNALPVDLIFAP